MDYSLSNDDIQNYLRDVKIVGYDEICNYPSAAELVKPRNECVILYRTNTNYGHWCCLIKNKHGYEFFDPYGLILDDQLEYSEMEKDSPEEDDFREQFKQDKRYLTKLLSSVRCPVSYNHHKIQKWKLSDGLQPSTCGRHVIMRILNKNKSLNRYKVDLDDALEKSKLNNYDELVTQLITLPGESVFVV